MFETVRMTVPMIGIDREEIDLVSFFHGIYGNVSQKRSKGSSPEPSILELLRSWWVRVTALTEAGRKFMEIFHHG